MTQSEQVSPEDTKKIEATLEKVQVSACRTCLSRVSIISLLGICGLSLLLFTGLVFDNVFQALQASAEQKPQTGLTTAEGQAGPLVHATQVLPASPLPLSSHQQIIYEKQGKLYAVPTSGGTGRLLQAPGYSYNYAVPPLLLPSGQLLYSGDGLWLADLRSGNAEQIATMPEGQVITSMVVSSDGTHLAWSTAPANGAGAIRIFAGPLRETELVYQQPAGACPCFRAFSFFPESNTMLLLTDDRGDHHAVQIGLWALDVSKTPAGEPLPLLDEELQKGPLALVPRSNSLLFAGNQGIVPEPTDHSVPDEVATLNYANSLFLATINTVPPLLSRPSVVLPRQSQTSNIAETRWVATPMFSPSGRTLAYILFSSGTQDPWRRHSALYTVQLNGSGAQLHAGKPQLLASSTARFVELGPWLNENVLTFYADGGLYAVDVHTATVQQIESTGGAYARIVGIAN
ncbi:MAG: hypothetical protein IMW89_04270 [Ktedonobacteraceae bacterium]|nr:hypothetical protein [Ktedonobacteraceae bacterium]